MVTKEQIGTAREVDFLTVLDKLGIEYSNQSGHVKLICPFHEEMNQSFSVYPDNKGFCFGCKISLDIIDFVRKVCDSSFEEAVVALNKISNE